MLRTLAAVLTFASLVASASAKEYKGIATKLDSEKKTITLKIDDSEKTFSFSDSTEFLRMNGKPIPQQALSKMASRFGDKGPQVTLATDEKDGKEVTKDGNAVASKVTFAGGKKNSK
jgi:hypothetical protein